MEIGCGVAVDEEGDWVGVIVGVHGFGYGVNLEGDVGCGIGIVATRRVGLVLRRAEWEIKSAQARRGAAGGHL